MKNQDNRSVMSILSRMSLTDDQVLYFIKEFARTQSNTTLSEFKAFCKECVLSYTRSSFTCLMKANQGFNEDEMAAWEESLLEEIKLIKPLGL